VGTVKERDHFEDVGTDGLEDYNEINHNLARDKEKRRAFFEQDNEPSSATK
jgi:hypothetical protein